jgi:hypothetical protein
VFLTSLCHKQNKVEDHRNMCMKCQGLFREVYKEMFCGILHSKHIHERCDKKRRGRLYLHIIIIIIITTTTTTTVTVCDHEWVSHTRPMQCYHVLSKPWQHIQMLFPLTHVQYQHLMSPSGCSHQWTHYLTTFLWCYCNWHKLSEDAPMANYRT